MTKSTTSRSTGPRSGTIGIRRMEVFTREDTSITDTRIVHHGISPNGFENRKLLKVNPFRNKN